MKVATGELPCLGVFGDDYDTPDGTGVRDYIHVVDLAKGHVAAIEKYNKPGVHICNLGTGQGYSVLEIVHAFEKVNGVKVKYEIKKEDLVILQLVMQIQLVLKRNLDGLLKRL